MYNKIIEELSGLPLTMHTIFYFKSEMLPSELPSQKFKPKDYLTETCQVTPAETQLLTEQKLAQLLL